MEIHRRKIKYFQELEKLIKTQMIIDLIVLFLCVVLICIYCLCS